MIKQLFNNIMGFNMLTKLHRWTLFKNNQYLSCIERIERCHSMNYEDYSLGKIK